MSRRGRRGTDSIGARRRSAVERLRRDLAELDGSADHPYFRSLRRQLGGRFEAELPVSDVVANAALADIVYVGDFHAVTAYQTFAADLIEALQARVRSLAVGVEFLFSRQQPWLDARQAGRIDDEAFLERIRYNEEWGYPWEGLRALLDRARRSGIPVYGLDAPPRGGYGGLTRRDAHAARRIASIAAEDPRRRVVVLFGESHLARGHLPRQVKRRLKSIGLERREVCVFQNPDALYWSALDAGAEPPRAVRVDPANFAVFHTSPLDKYEAYRMVLERWRSDEDDAAPDYTASIHHLIDVLRAWIGVRPDRVIRHRGEWSDQLADVMPEVYSGDHARRLLVGVMRDAGVGPDRLDSASAELSERGLLYDPASNALFALRYDLGRAASEAARFLRVALTGRLYDRRFWPRPEGVHAALALAYDEAIAQLGARLVDPTIGSVDRVGRARSSGHRAGRPVTAGRAVRTGGVPDAGPWLAAVRRAAAEGRRTMPKPLESALEGPGAVDRARELGGELGRLLFDRVRAGALDRSGLRLVFARKLLPAKAPAVVLRILGT